MRPPSSFPHLPQICPLQGRSVDFNLIYSSARRPAADRVGPLPRPANTAVGQMGLKWTDVFLWRRPLIRFQICSLSLVSPPRGRRFLFYFTPGEREASSDKQQQAHRHDRHAGDQAIDGQVMLSIFPGGRQQLVEGDEHHDAGHGGKNYTKDRLRHDGHQQ